MRWVLALTLLVCCACGQEQPVSSPRRQQVDYGAGIYRYECARCHDPRRPGPALGRAKLSRFATADALEAFLKSSMPADRPGLLTADDAWAVVAYLLSNAGLTPSSGGSQLGVAP